MLQLQVKMTETEESKFNGITWPDYLVIALYFIFVLGVGLYVSLTLLYLYDFFWSVAFVVVIITQSKFE